MTKSNERNSNLFRVPFRFAKALCHATTSYYRSTTRVMGIQPVTAQAGAGLFPHSLNPLARRVAPVGHWPSSEICDSKAGTHGMARRLRARDSQSCPIHNSLLGETGMARERLAEKFCRRHTAMRRTLSSLIREKLADPGLEGCAVKAKKVSANRFEELVRLWPTCATGIHESPKREQTLRRFARAKTGKKSGSGRVPVCAIKFSLNQVQVQFKPTFTSLVLALRPI